MSSTEWSSYNHQSIIQHSGPAHGCTYNNTIIINKGSGNARLDKSSHESRSIIVSPRSDKDSIGREVAEIIEILDKTISTISELQGQSQDASLADLEFQLMALKFAWSGIGNRMGSSFGSPHYQLMIDMNKCIVCVRSLISMIDEVLSQLQVTADDHLDNASKFTLLLQTKEAKNMRQMIKGQTNALNLLLTACNATIPLEQKQLLEEPRTRDALKTMEYSASLLVHRDVDSLLTRTASSITSSIRTFAFDSELFSSAIYVRWIHGSIKKTLRKQQSDNLQTIQEGQTSRSLPSIRVTTSLVISVALRGGTCMRKISKKKECFEQITLFLDWDKGELRWKRGLSSKAIDLGDIRKLQIAPSILQDRLKYGLEESIEGLFFTIIYDKPGKSKGNMLHLVADDNPMFEIWTGVLEAISNHYQEFSANLLAFNDNAAHMYWRHAAATKLWDRTGLSFEAVQRACQSLDMHVDLVELDVKFRRTLKINSNIESMLEFLRLMQTREDIREIYRSQATEPEKGLTFQDFQKFLRTVQREDIYQDPMHWEHIFTRFVRRVKLESSNGGEENGDPKPRTMPESAFVSFLTSKFNAPISEQPAEFTLNRPMNEYFISSSHNTYLLGRQVAGISSIEGYISALVRGCRSVEVSCWDGSLGQPMVTRGRTLSTSISFCDVITTINKYAFIQSRLPLWISLGVYCNPIQQAIMVDIMKEVFGSRLVTEPLDNSNDKLPSPSDLSERILIQVKKQPIKEDPLVGPKKHRNYHHQKSQYSGGRHSRKVNLKHTVYVVSDPQAADTSDDESGEDPKPQKTPTKITKELGDLGVYGADIKSASFDAAETKQHTHILSFTEPSFAKNQKIAVGLHNLRYMMRVSPSRTRINSSNFDPLFYWRRGVQMAALNWQTFDLGMQLNHAMFNGGVDSSGYVLKPAELRDIMVLPFNSDIAEGKKERNVVSFTIQIISAQQLLRPANLPVRKSMDPYVEVETYTIDERDDENGEPEFSSDTDTPRKMRTGSVFGNSFNPRFYQEFKFRLTTKHPEMVFVRWSIKLSNEQPAIATYTAKLVNLKQGYRTLPLLNHFGDQYLFSTLFCKITVDPVEKVLFDAPRRVLDGNRLNRLGVKVFERTNSYPKSTIETKSFEKTSFDSS